jgi:hypothetical protein
VLRPCHSTASKNPRGKGSAGSGDRTRNAVRSGRSRGARPVVHVGAGARSAGERSRSPTEGLR